ncbi:Major Facilitator Superfamily transporter [Desulfosporosinus orientis DSM 765]|uniref:Major Facilitator Superfamily transporter n=1 Tax=Desulfosporosinus orientis (strain ATCC 19365 / DSM 765 / NCIMB 8382 / VKM B-1628 / Singapore I) TaxID=768706 RepID=G7WD54_DESOD|nr:MFS transporter [Desulfosporosinus orientis]AET67249.1 Major Facilitator Superfamily transporter [Desulfosporosinus orientis DSM 765]
MTAFKEQKKILGLEWNIFFTGLTSFLTDTTTKMIYAVLPLFLISIGATKTELSLIEGIAESTASILKALSGWWSDKIGRNKPFMIVGYAMTTMLSPLFSGVTSPLQALIIRFIERVGKGIRTAPRDSLIAGSSNEKAKGKSFGFHKAMDNSGAIIGPLLAFVILIVFPNDYRKVFLISVIPATLGLLAIIIFVKEAKKTKDELPGKINWRDFPKRYYLFLAIVFIFTLGNSTDALLLVKANDVGIKALFIPLVYLIFNIVSVAFAVPAGMLSDKFGRERLIIFGYLLYSIIYFGFGRTHDKIVVILLFALYGLYSAATDGVQKALVSDLIDKKKRGTGLGIYNSLVGMTLLPASLIAGVLYDKVDSKAPFYFGSIMALIAALFMYGLYKKKVSTE